MCKCKGDTYSLVTRKAGCSLYGIVCSLHVLSDLCCVLVGSLVKEDAVHLNALAAVRPSGIGLDVLQNIVKSPVAITGPYIAHGSRVGESIEFLDSWKIVLIWQSRITRSAVWVNNNGVIEIGCGVQSTVISTYVRSCNSPSDVRVV